jgi:hypothetical protein
LIWSVSRSRVAFTFRLAVPTICTGWVAVAVGVEVGVACDGVVGVGVRGVEVGVGVNITTMRTQKGAAPPGPMPKSTLEALRIFQLPWYLPDLFGATISTEMSTLCPGATSPARDTLGDAPIWSPEKKATA